MPSRRNVLATSGGVLTTALAGCQGLGESDGTPVRFEDSAVERPSGDDVEVVAREQGEQDGQVGAVTGEGAVYEPPDSEHLILFAEYRDLTDADAGWEHTGFFELHNWSESDVSDTVRSHGSNVVSAGDESADGRLRNAGATDSGRWVIELDPAVGGTRSYRFRTTVGEAAGASAGDTIAVTSSDASFGAAGLLDDTVAELSLAFTFTYGDTDCVGASEVLREGPPAYCSASDTSRSNRSEGYPVAGDAR